MRVINLTEWRWPIEFDRSTWTWLKPDYPRHTLGELDQNFIKNSHDDKHGRLNMTKNWVIFSHLQLHMFVVVRIFFIFLIFSQTQSFLVMLNECMFLVVSFGQVQPNAVYRFRSNSTITFSHLHSVKLTSLIEFFMLLML